tara:strand:- start:70 stop:1020 length:951 start_codon:yes stop_codon:yes gene_type:complete
MIIVGGLTRLTDSGLSITEWELFKGVLPPLNNDSWERYFSLYKGIPQYQLINKDMTIEQFKIIYYWEYFHRMFGRIIGLFFLIPLLYFHFKTKIHKKYLYICYLILFLIIVQGIVGWYMVKSGLVNDITVSHYRLSLHLSIAFFIISLIFWLILNIRKKTFKNFFTISKNNFLLFFLILIIFVQVIIGAFVSGLDAGKIYQTWPLMNSGYFPNDIIIKKVKDFTDLDNHSLVQFYHRNIAYFIIIYTFIVGFYIFKNQELDLMKPFYIFITILFIQVILGIITLISGLNIFLASGHQIFSLLLTLSAINLYYYRIN